MLIFYSTMLNSVLTLQNFPELKWNKQPMRAACNQCSVRYTLLGLILFGATGICMAQAEPAQNGDAAVPEAPSSSKSYQYISGKERARWFVQSTVGPQTLAVGVLSAAIGTARDAPKEYGPHWEGFGKRYGMRLTGVATGNLMEAGLGAVWGEDPRYFPAYRERFKARVKNVIVMTFLAHDREGAVVPAYARYIATAGNNFLSNSWRADSEANNHAAAVRTLLGFAGLMGKNAFSEFWPDVQRRIFHHKQ